MFADLDADVYILVDGDNTYDPESAPLLIDTLVSGPYDMVVGARDIPKGYRKGHAFGNKFLTKLVALFFGNQFNDILSGYRVFSYRFVKSFPALSKGFEIETELTIHALELLMPVAELETPYQDRPAGSDSKLHTLRDGYRILKTIVLLLKNEKPFPFFGIISLTLMLLSFVLAYPLIITYMATGLVPQVPDSDPVQRTDCAVLCQPDLRADSGYHYNIEAGK